MDETSSESVIEDAMSGRTKVRAVEVTYDWDRREWSLLIRRPVYCNLRLGKIQRAMWVGPSTRSNRGRSLTVFNWFPWPWSEYSRTLGRDSRATLFAQLRHHTQQLDILRHPDKAALYEPDESAPDADA